MSRVLFADEASDILHGHPDHPYARSTGRLGASASFIVPNAAAAAAAADAGEGSSSSSSLLSSTFKAAHRPGKGGDTTMLRRNSSAISLPSPPGDLPPSQSLNHPVLLRPFTATRKRALNPFLPWEEEEGRQTKYTFADRPEPVQESPSRRKRIDKERIRWSPLCELSSSPDRKRQRVNFNGGMIATPAQTPKAPIARGPLQEVKKGSWEDTSNPFVVRECDQEGVSDWRPGQAKKPEKVTYVFRGKRITYDVPLDALIGPPAEDEDDPLNQLFADPSPKLLFPPSSVGSRRSSPIDVDQHTLSAEDDEPYTPRQQVQRAHPSSSSFLEALKNSKLVHNSGELTGGTGDKSGHGRSGSSLPFGLPTPVQDKNESKEREKNSNLKDQPSRGHLRHSPYKEKESLRARIR